MTIHYILFRCLWEGRIGNDSTVKALLKKLYLIMDDTSDRGLFDELRASGGVMQVRELGTMRYYQLKHRLDRGTFH